MAALESHLVWLTVLGLLNTAVAAYYYLRLLVMMYMHEPNQGSAGLEPLSPGPLPNNYRLLWAFSAGKTRCEAEKGIDSRYCSARKPPLPSPPGPVGYRPRPPSADSPNVGPRVRGC